MNVWKVFLVILFAEVLISQAKILPCLNCGDEFSGNLLEKASSYINYLFRGEPSYRLPNNSIPLRYDLWIKSEIDEGNFDFSGRVKVHVKVLEATKKITMHSDFLEIDKIDLLVDGTLKASNIRFIYRPKQQFLVIFLPKMMERDQEFVLDIQYHGELMDGLVGFYRASYVNDKNKTVWYALTKLEPTYARFMMPCYDEPGIRAVINIQIQHSEKYNSVSNMPVISRERVEGSDCVTTKFRDTPPMQTYLIAFIISDFKFNSNNVTKVEQRIYAKPQSIDKGEADFSLKNVGEVLDKLEEVFGVPFPLDKVDHIAATQHPSSAMENFGAIIYQEDYLLFRPIYSLDRLKYNKKLMAHELVHQYFGNLVAPKWWSYTWLNEGFARFYESYVMSFLDDDEFYVDNMKPQSFVFEADDGEKPAMNAYVESPDEIRSKFRNVISYEKSAAVIGMFQAALTPPTFLKGLKYYLEAMSFSAATPEDLHRGIQKAFDEDFPENGFDVGAAMKTWEDQSGYPVLKVKKVEDKFVLSQETSADGEKLFTIPVSYATKSMPILKDHSNLVWMKEKSFEIDAKSDEDWIALNTDSSGYFKVSYDEPIYETLINNLQQNHTFFPAHFRAELLSVSADLFSKDSLPTTTAFMIFDFMKTETEYSVWKTFIELQKKYSQHLFGTKSEGKFQKFIHLLIKPVLDKLGFEPIESDSDNASSFRNLITKLACEINQEEFLRYKKEKFETSEDDLGFTDRCDGIKTANKETLSRLSLESKTEKCHYFLACSKNQTVIKSLLNTDNCDTENIIAIAMRESGESYETVLAFIEDNIDKVFDG
jgi:aminopeptidase N